MQSSSWSYLFEQPYFGRQICIADIVFSWLDDQGPAVLVLEAKVRGGKLTDKDLHGADRYLNAVHCGSSKAPPRLSGRCGG